MTAHSEDWYHRLSEESGHRGFVTLAEVSAAEASHNVLDQAADEIADDLLKLAAVSPDGAAFLDRLMDRLAQARYLSPGPVITEI
jgi:hypothetical protein